MNTIKIYPAGRDYAISYWLINIEDDNKAVEFKLIWL